MSTGESSGTDGGSSAPADTDLRVLIKESLTEILRENPNWLRPSISQEPAAGESSSVVLQGSRLT